MQPAKAPIWRHRTHGWVIWAVLAALALVLLVVGKILFAVLLMD